MNLASAAGQISDSGGRSQSSRVAGSSVDTTAATGNQILSVGKRLSSNAMLSYEQTLGKAESIVELTVKLTRQISLIGRASRDNAIDIFYTITLGDQRERQRRATTGARGRRQWLRLDGAGQPQQRRASLRGTTPRSA